jgi:membrane protease YdiL (CAAX protease family)
MRVCAARRRIAVPRLVVWLAGYARLSFALTALITSALFSVMHVYPVLFPVAFIAGFGAALVRERTGSSFTFVVAHAANSVTFLAAAYIMRA